MVVLDEDGERWYVAPEDPSGKFVEHLANFPGGAVLPKRSILEGIWPHSAEWEGSLSKLEKAFRATGDSDIGAAFLRMVRLWDCAALLDKLPRV